MKRSKNSFKLEENKNREFFWNEILIKPLAGDRDSFIDEEYDIKPTD